MVSPSRMIHCLNFGLAAEADFEHAARVMGYCVESSSKNENMYEHWDYMIQKDGGVGYLIDVKCYRPNQCNFRPNDTIWVEFANVHGKTGWLYGKADFIAYEDITKFHLISRPHLAYIAETKIKNDFVDHKNDALYHRYSRKGRKDVIGKLLWHDVCMGEIIFPKTNEDIHKTKARYEIGG